VTWTDTEQAALRCALAHVERRILTMPQDISGSATIHLQTGRLRKIEWRLLEPVELEEEHRDRV
jgi:hypothetical protein